MARYRQMEVFAAVVQAGSLASAARALALSPATVMRTVTALETRLGTVLLLRGPRGISLSRAGEQFAASCRLILEETAEAERSAAGLHSQPNGQLTVALPLLMANQVFTALAVQYLDTFPDVQLLTLARESMPKLLEEAIDVALVVGHLPDSSNFAVSIGTVRPIICASPAYLAQWGRPETADDLRAHRTLLATSTGHGPDWRLHGDTAMHTVRTTQVLTCTTQQGAIHAAACGLGLIRCMSYEVHQELQSGKLEPLFQDFKAPDLPAHMIYREGRKASARVRTFIDFAVPRLRLHPALQA
ncbi:MULTISPECIES: LysR family transcriptional regulator [Pseudomonas]|jgi:DNA-binding transcriptional LysR family regulator|uniref:LysR family transcriptional regulator n=1 Tax=Pseudomonas syringae TaxID=317 RepID=A0A085UV83_PSESX|nr:MULTISPECIES: LysR family transcriptional regulator [Pseudomonas]EPJ79979.1 LysR family transcriptional regulator [Pseudomonas sp. CFII64]KFE47096.1 LysR family transcriptional regulator [Pseudomonas syringae]